MLEISHRNENKQLQIFEIFEKYKVQLEKGFKDGLNWQFLITLEDSNKDVCRIYSMLDNVDFHRQNQWPEIFNFFIENMLLLEKNFFKIK